MSPPREPAALPGRQPRAVRNAFAVLEEVIAIGPGATAKEISHAIGLPSATTYRLLNLLVAEEYLVRLPGLGGFALGRRAARLCVPVAPRLPTAARAVLDHLREVIRWGVHLADLTTGRIVLTDPDPDHPPSEEALLARHPHASALGKLLLAEDTGAAGYDTDGLALPEPRRFTRHTITDRAGLTAELKEVSAGQLARSCGELRPDRGCLAVPVRHPATGALVAGLALSGPPARVAQPNRELIAVLREHADRLAPLLA
ncbi:IclR family transcriptional regulator C-terminal domain-containing protein [Streptomyces sp. HD1123-B1]|uniref:IclR family transcriptional regulator n=1 Tax=Streptomyces TaxID=1883 RepID=UPI0020C88949|nr:IclR family transcriptional regulator C-terminal domain-containing protein [Streptomyces sp. NEAU-Y11]MCP9207856.1 helix-turn-helix domain-containing protein [Streptomyces sp. NEAU-Y11]